MVFYRVLRGDRFSTLKFMSSKLYLSMFKLAYLLVLLLSFD
jgi:hypothetical protein